MNGITRTLVVMMAAGSVPICSVPMMAQSLLVDTGAAGISGGVVLANTGAAYQNAGGRFTLLQSATIDHVDAWMAVNAGGPVAVRIRNLDGAGLPGTVAYQNTFTPAASATGWVSFATPKVLAAGSYWLTLEPSAGTTFNAALFDGASAPLEQYAVMSDATGVYQASANSFGMRVWGTNFAASAFGTASRAIVDNPAYNAIKGGAGALETYEDQVDPAAKSVAAAAAKLNGGTLDSTVRNLNGLSVGAFDATCWFYYGYTCQRAGSRSLAWRTYTNGGTTAKTIRANVVLNGAFIHGGAAIAFLYAFKTAGFVATAGANPASFLLSPDTITDYQFPDTPMSLDRLFPGNVLSTGFTYVDIFEGPQSLPFSTGTFTVNPGDQFTLLFDVVAFSSGGGSANFLASLVPAADLFTASGAPVPEIVSMGAGLVPRKAVSSVVLGPATATAKPGTAATITAVVKDAQGVPVGNAPVYFQIQAGPHKGLAVPVFSDASGQAVLSYKGIVQGDDTIGATADGVAGNTVTRSWTDVSPLDLMVISPFDTTITIGDSQPYSVFGYDASRNPLGDVTSTTTFTITPDGSCVANLCTPALIGPHTVTGVNGTVMVTSVLNVVSPPDTVGPVTSGVGVSPTSLLTGAAAVLTATVDDAATGGSLIASATYSVNGGAPVAMVLTPGSAVTTAASASVGPFATAGTYTLCVRGTDASGNTGADACTQVQVSAPPPPPPPGGSSGSGTVGGTSFSFTLQQMKGKLKAQTTFDLTVNAGSFHFVSTALASLTVTGQPRAIFSGVGTDGVQMCQFEGEAWDGSYQSGSGKVDAVRLRVYGCGGSPADAVNIPVTQVPADSIVLVK